VFTRNTPELFSMFFEWIYSAPELLFDVYRSTKIPSPNVASYMDPRVDNLIKHAIYENQREKINQNLFQAEVIVSKSAPYIWLYHAQNMLLHKNTYSNVAINPHNHWLISEITVKRGK
jgi:ABC-type transport system substrate-binding protein